MNPEARTPGYQNTEGGHHLEQPWPAAVLSWSRGVRPSLARAHHPHWHPLPGSNSHTMHLDSSMHPRHKKLSGHRGWGYSVSTRTPCHIHVAPRPSASHSRQRSWLSGKTDTTFVPANSPQVHHQINALPPFTASCATTSTKPPTTPL